MTGFRSGKSGSLIRRAKTAGLAIGKRRVRSSGSLSSAPPPAAFNLPPPFFLSFNYSQKETAPTLRRIMAQESKPPLNPELIRPRSETAEMWKEYRIFKAAGLLAEWRKRWAWYLPAPA